MTIFDIFDKYIIQFFLALGVFGNIFMLIIIVQLFYGGYFKTHWKYNCPCFKKDGSNGSSPCKENIPTASAVTLQMSIYLFFLAISDIGFLISAFLSQEHFKKKLGNYNDNNIGQAYVNAFKGVSDVIVTFMTYHRLHSIWNIQTHNPDAISFRRVKQKIWSNNYWILVQIFIAFAIGFFFHLPFFIENNSVNGFCDFYELAPKNHQEESDDENWQTDIHCSLFLWIHITALKIIPTFLIVFLNMVIAWKLKEVWKKRKSIRKNAIRGLEIKIYLDKSPRNKTKKQDNCYLCEPQHHLQVSVSSEDETTISKFQTSNSPSIDQNSKSTTNGENKYMPNFKTIKTNSSKLYRIQNYVLKKKIARKKEKYRNEADEMIAQTILINELPFNISSKIQTTVSKVQEMNKTYDKYLKQKDSNEPSLKNKGHLTPVMKMKQGKMARVKNNSDKKKLARQKENLKNDTEKIILYSVLSIVTAGMFLLCTLMSNIPLFSYPINHEPFSWFTRNYLIIQHLLESFNYTCNFLIYCVANSDTRNAASNLIKTITLFCMIPLRWTTHKVIYLFNGLKH